MDRITRINGNGQPYTTDLPKIIIFGYFNYVALQHVKDNTGLDFAPTTWPGESYSAHPTESWQIAALFMTYNFKTRYYNNASNNNELHLRNDHHVGFDVDSICFDCVQHNHINTNGLKQGDRLAC